MTASKICPQCFLYSETNSASNAAVIPAGSSASGTASFGNPGISLVQLPKYCIICDVLRLELTSRSCSGWLLPPAAADDEDDGVVELGEAARRSPFEADCAEEEAAAAAAAAATAAAVEFTRSVFACGPDRDGSGRFFMTGLCGG